jgi:hypothetical protein
MHDPFNANRKSIRGNGNISFNGVHICSNDQIKRQRHYRPMSGNARWLDTGLCCLCFQ